MQQISGPVDLQSRISGKRGYLANKKEQGGTYRVHDLAHFCNAPVEFTPKDYPKYWAEKTDEFTFGWDPCGNCRRKRETTQ